MLLVLLLWIICVFVSCVSHAFASVHCCLMATCWERADILAFVGDAYCIFVTFPCGILGQVWYLIVSFPELCCLSYFGQVHKFHMKGPQVKSYSCEMRTKYVLKRVSFGSKDCIKELKLECAYFLGQTC